MGFWCRHSENSLTLFPGRWSVCLKFLDLPFYLESSLGLQHRRMMIKELLLYCRTSRRGMEGQNEVKHVTSPGNHTNKGFLCFCKVNFSIPYWLRIGKKMCTELMAFTVFWIGVKIVWQTFFDPNPILCFRLDVGKNQLRHLSHPMSAKTQGEECVNPDTC